MLTLALLFPLVPGVSDLLQNPPAPSSQQAGTNLQYQSPLKLIDISMIFLNDFSVSTAKESEFQSLHFGDHDPHKRGFTVANEELALSGIVDPYFRADAYVVYSIDADGESKFELEEARLTTLGLPYGLQGRFGQMYTQFGRQNTIHPHAWEFTDQPVVLSRMFGADGLRGPGADLSYLVPLPFFAELTLGAQNANGETAFSFLNAEGEVFAGRTLLASDVASGSDLLYLARLKTAFDLSDEITFVPGISALYGPNSSGPGKHTGIQGIDLYLKWKPLENDHGFPFVAFTSELIQRKYEAGADTTAGLPADTLRDWGSYAQILWGFTRSWVAGFRGEFARGNGDLQDELRDRRVRYSPNLTYYPSEFSKIRLQYNYDHADFLVDSVAHSIVLQFEVSFGVHGAHKF